MILSPQQFQTSLSQQTFRAALTAALAVPGPAGPPGAPGPAGPQGEPGARAIYLPPADSIEDLPEQGNEGELVYVDGAGSVYGWNDSLPPRGGRSTPGDWEFKGHIEGPPGLDGIPGTDSTVPGPKGEKGDPGLQGPAGAGIHAVVTGGPAVGANTTAVTSLLSGAGSNTLGSITIPAGVIPVGGAIEIFMIGTLTVPGSGAPPLTVYLYGGATVIGQCAVTVAAALNQRAGRYTLNAFIWRDTAATSKATGVLRLAAEDANINITQARFTIGTPVNFSSAVTLDIRAGFGAANANVSIRNDVTEFILRTI